MVHSPPSGPPGPRGLKVKRRVGVGLSLSKFASSRTSGYDPKALKEKERALNAKTVNKYRKLQKRLQGSGGGDTPGQVSPRDKKSFWCKAYAPRS